MIKISAYLLFVLFCCFQQTMAADVPFNFENQAQEQRYKDLIEELRCLVCQNQSLADSNADLAQDLRNEVFHKIVDGRSDNEIIDFLVTRYGDFVLYRPPLKKGTFLLWFGPFFLFLMAIIIIILFVRKRGEAPVTPLSHDEQHRLDDLLNQSSQEKHN